jgi:hypothetical protein
LCAFGSYDNVLSLRCAVQLIISNRKSKGGGSNYETCYGQPKICYWNEALFPIANGGALQFYVDHSAGSAFGSVVVIDPEEDRIVRIAASVTKLLEWLMARTLEAGLTSFVDYGIDQFLWDWLESEQWAKNP